MKKIIIQLICLIAIVGSCQLSNAQCSNGGSSGIDIDGDGYCSDVDCNDNNNAIHPGATELCNGIDDNCDGLMDEDLTTTYYEDADGDGYGNNAVSQIACTQPAGYVTDNTDCNDGNAAINPRAIDSYDGIDNDCDGIADQNSIVRFQYFFDTEPGVGLIGNGAFIDVSPTSDSSNITTSISTAGLSEGFHTLYMRAQSVKGSWGLWRSYPFTITPPPTITNHTVTHAEYFFDTETGVASAIQLPIGVTPADSVNFISSIPITGLNEGFHTLYLRVKDSQNHWGLWRSYPFTITPPPAITNHTVTHAEYFFDTETGVASAIQLPIGVSPADSVNFISSIPTTGLNEGFHTLYLRVKDSENHWGLWRSYPFTITPPPAITNHTVTHAEYYFDTETGVASAIQLPIGVSPADSVNFISSIPSTGLSEGFHTLYLRVKDSQNHWGLWRSYPFAVTPPPPAVSQITDGEAFFDTDPGVGNGIQLWLPTAPLDSVNISRNVFAPNSLGNGTHYAYFRWRDSNGKWGLYDRASFTVSGSACILPAAITANGPVTICTGEQVILTENSMGAFTWQWKESGNPVGSNSRHLTVNSSGTYTCEVTSGSCTATSNVIVVAVYPPQTWYEDNDGDGFGNASVSQVACIQPSGYVSSNTDCDDTSILIHAPVQYFVDADHDGYGSTNTAMVCSLTPPLGYSANDTDCDDNNVNIHAPVQYFVDADHDGYGSTNTAMVCSLTPPLGYSANDTDCDDNNVNIHAPVQYYVDADHDGYGSTITAMVCSLTPPLGYSTNDTDCDDNNVNIHAEVQYFVDADHDGYGSATTAMLCELTPPLGYSTNDTDCDDNNVNIHAEVQYFVDADHDGYGSTNTAMVCSLTPPLGYSTNDTDCDDNNVNIHAPVQYFVDADHDGYGSATTAMLCELTPPLGYSTNSTDCSDNNANIHPGAPEICGNGIDDNCDGLVDVGCCQVVVSASVTQIVCRGDGTGSILVSSSGGNAPYTYLWNNGSTNQNRFSLTPGTYTVTVKDAGLCSKTASYSITQPPTNLILNTVKTNVRCPDGVTGTASVSPAGGFAPYSYQWNTIPVQTIASITGLAGGIYTCSITDANGCTRSVQLVITEPPPFLVIPTQTNVTFPGGNNGTASVAVSGGTPGYTYSWNTVPVKTTSTITGLTAGSYKCTIADSKSCPVKVSVTITQPVSRSIELLSGSEKAGMEVFPNPTHGKITLKFKNLVERECFEFFLSDPEGRILFLKKQVCMSGNDLQFDFSSFSAGVYCIKCISSKNNLIQKFILE